MERKPYTARFEHTCSVCNKPIAKGDEVTWSRKTQKIMHNHCKAEEKCD